MTLINHANSAQFSRLAERYIVQRHVGEMCKIDRKDPDNCSGEIYTTPRGRRINSILSIRFERE